MAAVRGEKLTSKSIPYDAYKRLFKGTIDGLETLAVKQIEIEIQSTPSSILLILMLSRMFNYPRLYGGRLWVKVNSISVEVLVRVALYSIDVLETHGSREDGCCLCR
jgi:hypothetical protein